MKTIIPDNTHPHKVGDRVNVVVMNHEKFPVEFAMYNGVVTAVEKITGLMVDRYTVLCEDGETRVIGRKRVYKESESGSMTFSKDRLIHGTGI